ncbi:MAG: tyrosine-type recombinase/integrase [Firmicutes bacterium]|nr:tyrosine-type recombinase/integrase [Bacillota bacterium]
MTDQKSIHELIKIVRGEMYRIGYSKYTLRSYEKAWEAFIAFADENGIQFYSTEIGLAFLEQKYQFVSNNHVKHMTEEKVRAINRLDEYYKYHTISAKAPLRRKHTFPQEFHGLVFSYIAFKKAEGISDSRINAIKLYLERFTNHLYNSGLRNIIELDVAHIHNFIESSTKYNASTVRNTFTCLRGFLSFVHEKGYLDKNLSFVVPSIRHSRECTIPSAYSKDEVEKILNCIDRCNIKGKRDYAMLLLAARLGLRASDICNLTLTNLNWEQNLIEIVQEKTKKTLQLPLLNEVGDAIIDYLRFRPKVPFKYVFLRIGNPPGKLYGHSLYMIVSRYISRAGVHVPPGKKHGPHALRHSLSSIMLENRVPLPVISEILSHASSDTTKVYLKIDISQLRECALEVPVIGNSGMGVWEI